MRFSILSAGPERLDAMQELWEGLNQHHESVSEFFADHFQTADFSARKAYLLEKTRDGELRLFLALPHMNDAGSEPKPVGYCVASLLEEEDGGRPGEIESIFVHENYRRMGAAHQLMTSALQWLDDNGATSKCISVVWGNEQAWPFYRKYGFYPRMARLVQK